MIKIEPPGVGDPLRKWRLLRDGTSVWWQVQSRNKRSIVLDLRSAEGQDIGARAGRRGRRADRELPARHARRLGPGLGRSCTRSTRGSIMLRISGYGQTGPYRDQPGFGVIGEAMGGLRHLTGEPGRVPVRVRRLDRRHAGRAARRDRRADRAAPPQRSTAAQGQVIDVALYESVFNVMESLLPEYERVRRGARARRQRAARHRADQRLPLQRRRLRAGRRQRRQHLQAPDGGDRPRRPRQRSALQAQRRPRRRRDELDAAIGAWTAQRTRQEVLAALDAAQVPAGRSTRWPTSPPIRSTGRAT